MTTMTAAKLTLCAQCRRPLAGTPVMLGKRIACCTAKCAAEFAVEDYTRLEAWLSVILVKSRGMASDMATSALYSNLYPAKTYRRKL